MNDIKPFGTLDIESELIESTKEQKFIIGGGTDNGYEYFEFFTANDLINFCISSKTNLFYFHNIDYDYRFLINDLKKYKKKYIIRGSRFLRLRVYDKNDNFLFELRDSIAVIPISLKKLTKSLCSKYLKQDFDIKRISELKKYCIKENIAYKELILNHNSNSIKNDNINNLLKDLRYYLRHDVLSLHEGLTNYMLLKNKDRLNLTSTSEAKSNINSYFNIKRLLNDSKYEDTIFRPSYFGGRCEVFKQKVKFKASYDILNYFDFNQLYLSVMCFNEFPIGNLKIIKSLHDYYPFSLPIYLLIFLDHVIFRLYPIIIIKNYIFHAEK